MRWLALVIGLSALFATRTYADTIAMLPLDGEKRLEIYGQPVAAEIARSLKAAGLDVVVVGAKMEVPDRAQLIVDGTIKAEKNKQITLSIRVRDPRDGTVLDTLPAPATALDNLDKAAADLSARVVPAVKARLEALAKAPSANPILESKPIATPVGPAAPAAPTLSAMAAGSGQRGTLLRNAFEHELATWTKTQPYRATLALQVVAYSPQPGKVPMARARVRARVSDSGGIKFDRVIRTDTIVGDRDGTPEQLAERTAREVLTILRPHLRRALAP